VLLRSLLIFLIVGVMGEETPARILVSDEIYTVFIDITVLEQLGLETYR
jgi:hypothetical protein